MGRNDSTYEKCFSLPDYWGSNLRHHSWTGPDRMDYPVAWKRNMVDRTNRRYYRNSTIHPPIKHDPHFTRIHHERNGAWPGDGNDDQFSRGQPAGTYFTEIHLPKTAGSRIRCLRHIHGNNIRIFLLPGLIREVRLMKQLIVKIFKGDNKESCCEVKITEVKGETCCSK